MIRILTIGLLPVQSSTDVRIVTRENKVPERIVLGLAKLSGVIKDCQQYCVHDEVNVLCGSELEFLLHVSRRVADV